MSHFKTLVIGDNVEAQLAPFDENLEVAPFVAGTFDVAETLKKARAWDANEEENGHPHKYTARTPDNEVLNDWFGGDGWRINPDTGLGEELSTRNPKAKWDYWTVGGRYGGHFKILPGADPEDFAPAERHWTEGFGNKLAIAGASDHAKKRAIDFPRMVDAAAERAAAEWREYETATSGIAPPPHDWPEHLETFGVENINEARRVWGQHPWIKATRTLDPLDAFTTYHVAAPDPQAAHLAKAKDMAVAGFYAVVQDGEWSARGDMGWFGLSDDKVDEHEWRSKVRELIESLPPDTILTNVDCHI